MLITGTGASAEPQYQSHYSTGEVMACAITSSQWLVLLEHLLREIFVLLPWFLEVAPFFFSLRHICDTEKNVNFEPMASFGAHI